MTVQRYPSTFGATSTVVSTDQPDTVLIGHCGGPMSIDVYLDRDNAAELHRQLGRWLGANPTGLIDVCPGSGQPPATHVPRARQGTCAACGDRFMVTSRGLVYKHRRRP